MKTKAVLVHGKDDFGRFVVGAGNCVHCGSVGISVKYAPKRFDALGVDTAYTILKDPKNKIGITCGCYAKLHRQVAHITTKRKRNG